MGRYIITDGKKYIGIDEKARIVKVENIRDAKVFSSPDKCRNVIKHNLDSEKTKWFYAPIDSSKAEINWDKETSEQMIVYLGKEVKRTTMNDYFDKLKEIAEEIDLKYLNLKNDLDIVEKEIVDIYHAIEFYDMSASKGYKIYKMLQERLQKRRAIKDELEKISIIFDVHIKKDSMNKAMEKLNHMEARGYVPRVMVELFS